MISADLGQQLENFVARLVETGRYGSKSDVLREGVRLIQEREAQLAALDAVLLRAVAEADAGAGKPAAETDLETIGDYIAQDSPSRGFDPSSLKKKAVAFLKKSSAKDFFNWSREVQTFPRPRLKKSFWSAKRAPLV